MSTGRATAIAVALVVAALLCGACSSGSSKSGAASTNRGAASTRAAVARERLAAYRRRVRAKEIAAIKVKERVAIARRHPRRKAQPKSAPRVTRAVVTDATTSPVNDLAAIERTVSALNAEFRASVTLGIRISEPVNYWVGAGMYSANECGAFETARGGGIVSEEILLDAGSLAPAPGWVDPVIGRVPQGRIYQVGIDEIQTLVTTGSQRERAFRIHVMVLPSGHARLFLRCA